MSEPRALEVLRRVFGYESFRGEQQAIVDHVKAAARDGRARGDAADEREGP